MKIDELQANNKVINLIGTFDSLEEQTVTPTGQKVQEGIISDETGQVMISLWDDYAGQFKVGDKICMSTGWCKVFQEELKISTGRFGRIRKVPSERPE